MKRGPRRAYENPYTKAVAWIANLGTFRQATGDAEGAVSSRQKTWFYRRLSQLDPTWGRRLDQLGATMNMARWVASPGPRERLAEVERRYRKLVEYLEGRSKCLSFTELRESMSTFDPATGEELAPRFPLLEAEAAG